MYSRQYTLNLVAREPSAFGQGQLTSASHGPYGHLDADSLLVGLSLLFACPRDSAPARRPSRRSTADEQSTWRPSLRSRNAAM